VHACEAELHDQGVATTLGNERRPLPGRRAGHEPRAIRRPAQNSINPFSIYGIWLAGTGVAITSKLGRGAAYSAVLASFLLGALMLSVLAMFQGGPR
jgi:hypothetical protein